MHSPWLIPYPWCLVLWSFHHTKTTFSQGHNSIQLSSGHCRVMRREMMVMWPVPTLLTHCHTGGGHMLEVHHWDTQLGPVTGWVSLVLTAAVTLTRTELTEPEHIGDTPTGSPGARAVQTPPVDSGYRTLRHLVMAGVTCYWCQTGITWGDTRQCQCCQTVWPSTWHGDPAPMTTTWTGDLVTRGGDPVLTDCSTTGDPVGRYQVAMVTPTTLPLWSVRTRLATLTAMRKVRWIKYFACSAEFYFVFWTMWTTTAKSSQVTKDYIFSLWYCSESFLGNSRKESSVQVKLNINLTLDSSRMITDKTFYVYRQYAGLRRIIYFIYFWKNNLNPSGSLSENIILYCSKIWSESGGSGSRHAVCQGFVDFTRWSRR